MREHRLSRCHIFRQLLLLLYREGDTTVARRALRGFSPLSCNFRRLSAVNSEGLGIFSGQRQERVSPARLENETKRAVTRDIQLVAEEEFNHLSATGIPHCRLCGCPDDEFLDVKI
jgi:hypothetical protein